MKIYEGPGRGRKQCPKCQKYIHVRSSECGCGHVFNQKKTPKQENKEYKTFDGPGKGRKQCLQCKKYVGVRNQVCICGYKFEKIKEVQPEKEEKVVEQKKSKNDGWDDTNFEDIQKYAERLGAGNTTIVYAASGSSPKLNGVDQETVTDFCQLLVNQGVSEGKLYTVRAIKQLGRSQLSVDDSYRDFCKHVDNWYDSLVN